jgi:predicted amidohydrolase YtcJ
MFLEDRVGTVEVGKEADLAVWDRNPYAVPSVELKDLVCQMTFVRGRVVYRAESGGPPVR